jgi:hypothetical protein
MRLAGWTAGALALAAAAGILAFAAQQATYREALAQRLPWALDALAARHDAGLSGTRIEAVHVSISVDPGAGAFSAEAALSVRIPEGMGAPPSLLLNEALQVGEVRVGARPVGYRREGLLLELAEPLPPGPHAIAVEYRYDPSPTGLTLGRISSVDVILPGLSLWYPMDLQSGHRFSAEARLPAGMQVITTGRVFERRSTATREIVRWGENVPVFAAPLVAGVAVREGLPGAVRHFALGPQDLPGMSPRWREDAARLDAFLRQRLGDPGHAPLICVQTAAVAQPEPVGAGIVLVPSAFDSASHRQFVALGWAMARVWWGDMVTGRWFAAEAEGGRWLTEALPQYYALRALESLRGEAARLAHVDAEERPWRPAGPLRDRALRESLSGGLPDGDFLWQGAQVASLLAAFSGVEQFDAGAQRFLSVHQGRSVGTDVFLSELALGGGRGFPANAAAWLDDANVADPLLASVVAGQEEVLVRVATPGERRPLPPMEIALFSSAGVRLHQVDPSRTQGAITLPTPAPVERVVLDPQFRLPDADRRNNVWPGAVWPGSLAVHPEGAIAVGLRERSNAPEISGVLLSSVLPGVEQRLGLPQGAAPEMAWSPDGAQLALGGSALQVWTQSGGVRLSLGEPAYLLGWTGGICWAYSPLRGAMINAVTGATLEAVPGELPRPLTLREGAGMTGQVAVLGDGSVATRLPGGTGWQRLSLVLSAVGDAAWSAGLEAWLAMDRSRGLVAVGGDGEERVLLELPYGVTLARMAPDGSHAGWCDPAGKLRVAAGADPRPVAVVLPGRVSDFAWLDGARVVAMVQEVSPVLPSAFHATSSLWLVSAADGAAERLGTLSSGPDGTPYLRRGR